MRLEFKAVGTPRPQGSHRGFKNPKTGHVIITNDNPETNDWKATVRHAALAALAGRTAAEGPVEVHLYFLMPRPGYHFGTGRNAGVLKASAPTYVSKKPDLDKLVRSTLDALTEAQAFRDDAQVASVTAAKGYATHPDKPGVRVVMAPITEPTVPVSGDEAVEAGTVHTQGALL